MPPNKSPVLMIQERTMKVQLQLNMFSFNCYREEKGGERSHLSVDKWPYSFARKNIVGVGLEMRNIGKQIVITTSILLVFISRL